MELYSPKKEKKKKRSKLRNTSVNAFDAKVYTEDDLLKQLEAATRRENERRAISHYQTHVSSRKRLAAHKSR